MVDKSVAARATIWSAVDLFARQFVSFFITLILARLLSPSEFGVAALLLLAIQLCTVPLQLGIFTALVQAPTLGTEQTSTVFWLSLAVSLLLGLLLILVAPSLASFFEQPVLQPLLAVAAAY
ncbi:MAG: hypothetical protein QOI38_2026, partial [Sphingomonadales bacterium]|nr:hypothetical protein [Sphingomonadales bacterium]